MRTRMIRTSFWEDARVAGLQPHARLTLTGLWCLADDGGYFEWAPVEIAANLYRYDDRATRETTVLEHLGAVKIAGLVKQLECLRHGLIPTMETHRQQSGRHTYPIRDKHRTECVVSRGIPGNSKEPSLRYESSRIESSAAQDSSSTDDPKPSDRLVAHGMKSNLLRH